MPIWIKSGIRIPEASRFMIIALTLFHRHKPLPFLALWNWNVEGSFERPEFSSSNKIEEAIAKIWDEFTFDEVQSVFHNWMSRLAWVIGNGGEYTTD
jgi:hypothetical protein